LTFREIQQKESTQTDNGNTSMPEELFDTEKIYRLVYSIGTKVEDLLVKRKWQGTCLRLNIAQKDDIVTSGKSGNFKVAKVMSNLLTKKEKELKEAIQYIAPEWFGRRNASYPEQQRDLQTT
jgi:hypothetical protein